MARISGPTLLGSTRRWLTSNKFSASTDFHLPRKGRGCPKVAPGVGAASDVRDLGADIDGVEAAIAGVE